LDLGDFALGLLALAFGGDQGDFPFALNPIGGAALLFEIDGGLGQFRLDLFEALVGD
jgi:hypothetical protein